MKRICRDRISNLPDEIRMLILSFLTTRRAFTTILLSKQWKHIFPSLQVVRIYQDRRTKEAFNAFVDQTLRFYDESTRIDEFYLSADIDRSPKTTDWVSWVTSHHVRQLFIHNRLKKRFFNGFPSSLFTSTSLTKLELIFVQLNFPKPSTQSTVFFPMLDRLRLENVSFHQPTNTFFSTPNCPRLRILILKKCHLKKITIHSPTLSYLYIYDSNRNPNISFSTPNLNQLRYTAKQPPNVSAESLSSLIYAAIIIRPYRKISQVKRLTQLASNLLKGLHKVIGLKITRFYPEYLNRVNSLAIIPSLKYLELAYSSGDQNQAKRLFKCFPALEVLHIYVMEPSIRLLYGSDSNKEACESKETSDEADFKSLRVVEMKSFNATASELDTVTYLLENAIVLEQMKIRYNNEDSKMKIEEMLFPKASPSVKILLSKSNSGSFV